MTAIARIGLIEIELRRDSIKFGTPINLSVWTGGIAHHMSSLSADQARALAAVLEVAADGVDRVLGPSREV